MLDISHAVATIALALLSNLMTIAYLWGRQQQMLREMHAFMQMILQRIDRLEANLANLTVEVRANNELHGQLISRLDARLERLERAQ